MMFVIAGRAAWNTKERTEAILAGVCVYDDNRLSSSDGLLLSYIETLSICELWIVDDKCTDDR